MKIIILGAGQVGASLAEHLADEQNDITVVDLDSDRLRELQDRLDIGTVTGQASHPDALQRAGAEDADMVIAVTNSDEINMVACQVAYTLFRTPTKISRIRALPYLEKRQIDSARREKDLNRVNREKHILRASGANIVLVHEFCKCVDLVQPLAGQKIKKTLVQSKAEVLGKNVLPDIMASIFSKGVLEAYPLPHPFFYKAIC